MAIRFYDEALHAKIGRWLKRRTAVTVLGPEDVERLFQIQADLSGDKPLTLPLVALSRASEFEILSVNQKPLSREGAKLLATDEKGSHLSAIPVSIKYQLDVYTKGYAEGDEYLRNFIFNFVNHPKLKISIPYNGSTIEHVSSVTLDGTVQDNSDVPQRLFPGQFTRWTLGLTIDDAYLFSVPFDATLSVSADDVVGAEGDEI